VAGMVPSVQTQTFEILPSQPTSSDSVLVRYYIDDPQKIAQATLRWENSESSNEDDALIASSNTWRYWKGNTEPSTGIDWTEQDYDDTNWSTGRGGFGYGDTDSVITELGDMRRNYSTFYIRREFNISDLSELGSVRLSIDYDDGFVAYLNGREIARSNAPSNLNNNSIATGSHESVQFESFEIGAAEEYLNEG